MSRQEDFKKAADDYVEGEPNGAQKIVGQVGFEFGTEYGYQYAKKMIENYLLCVELSNFFPTLSDEDADKGKEALTKAIKEFLEEM